MVASAAREASAADSVNHFCPQVVLYFLTFFQRAGDMMGGPGGFDMMPPPSFQNSYSQVLANPLALNSVFFANFK